MAMEREARPARPGGRKRRKVCQFCVDKCQHIDYKDTVKLRRYLSERSKILPRRTTGTCAMHQRPLTEAIKRARQIALLPYVNGKESLAEFSAAAEKEVKNFSGSMYHGKNTSQPASVRPQEVREAGLVGSVSSNSLRGLFLPYLYAAAVFDSSAL